MKKITKCQDTNGISPERLGKQGELFFNTLCTNGGFIANSSQADDKGGWDFEVEIPTKKEIDYSNRSYPVYRIQVKASICKHETGLTYSNLLKLIQYNEPSFIVLVKYSNSGAMAPDSCFILHIDEKVSMRILKDMRKRELNSKGFQVNKNEKVIKLLPKDQMEPMDGTGLKAGIQKSIGGNYLKYVENKVRYLKEFEKEGQLKSFHWTFKTEADLKGVVNCFLGYNNRFNIDIDTYDAPFGIEDLAPVSMVKDYNTTIEVFGSDLRRMKIFLRASKHGKEYEFPGTTYTVPEELHGRIFGAKKARTKCTLFDILLDFNAKSIKMVSVDLFRAGVDVTFEEMHDFLCFINETMKTNETYIRCQDSDSDRTAELFLGASNYYSPANFKFFLEAIQAGYKKLAELNLERSVVSTKYVWENIDRFDLFRIVDQQYDPPFVRKFAGTGEEDFDCNVVILSSRLQLEKKAHIALVAFFGMFERLDDKEFLGRFTRSEFLGEYLIGGDDDVKSLILSEFQRYRRVLTERGFKVLNQGGT